MVRTVFVQYLQMVILKKQDYEHQTKCETLPVIFNNWLFVAKSHLFVPIYVLKVE